MSRTFALWALCLATVFMAIAGKEIQATVCWVGTILIWAQPNIETSKG